MLANDGGAIASRAVLMFAPHLNADGQLDAGSYTMPWPGGCVVLVVSPTRQFLVTIAGLEAPEPGDDADAVLTKLFEAYWDGSDKVCTIRHWRRGDWEKNFGGTTH